MSDLRQQLEVAKAMQQSIVNQANQMEEQKQILIQEALRFDGEIRLLERQIKKESGLDKPE